MPVGFQFAKFSLVGGTGAGISLLMLYVLTEAGGAWYMHSAIIATVIAGIWNFSGYRLWAFRKGNSKHPFSMLESFVVKKVKGGESK